MGISWRGKEVIVGAAVWGTCADWRTPPVRRPARRDARLLEDIVEQNMLVVVIEGVI